MSRLMDRLAEKASARPEFLAYTLAAYMKSHSLTPHERAASLECSMPTLTHLSICLRPRPDPFFEQDVERIAAHCRVNPTVLAAIVRQVDCELEIHA